MNGFNFPLNLFGFGTSFGDVICNLNGSKDTTFSTKSICSGVLVPKKHSSRLGSHDCALSEYAFHGSEEIYFAKREAERESNSSWFAHKAGAPNG